MAKENKTLEVNEREIRIIRLAKSLSDKELFGIECIIAGMRVREMTKETAAGEHMPEGAVV